MHFFIIEIENHLRNDSHKNIDILDYILLSMSIKIKQNDRRKAIMIILHSISTIDFVYFILLRISRVVF